MAETEFYILLLQHLDINVVWRAVRVGRGLLIWEKDSDLNVPHSLYLKFLVDVELENFPIPLWFYLRCCIHSAQIRPHWILFRQISPRAISTSEFRSDSSNWENNIFQFAADNLFKASNIGLDARSQGQHEYWKPFSVCNLDSRFSVASDCDKKTVDQHKHWSLCYCLRIRSSFFFL